MRCFTAIELNAAWRRALGEWVARRRAAGARDVRWCTPEQLHITLTFLGEIEPSRVSAICDALAAVTAAIEPFDVALAGLGAFPSRGWPRVLWAGVDDPTRSTAQWVAAAADPLEGFGVPRESRPYTPHITLARSRSARGGELLQRAAAAAPPASVAPLNVGEVVLYESRLDRSGAQYVAVARFALGT